MKIGIFSTQYLPTMGGIERYTCEVAHRFIRAGHSVCIITSALNGLPQKEISIEGIVIYRLPIWALMEQRFPIPRWNSEFRMLTKQIWAEKFDAFIVQARFYVGSIYMLRQAACRNIPTILIDHSSGHLQPTGRLTVLIGHYYEHLSAKIVKRYCSNIFGVSQRSCTWLEHLGLKAEGAFFNSVDIEEIDYELVNGREINWKNILGLDDSDRIILFSGRLIPEKGIVSLIQAVSMTKRSDYHLVIAGDGPLLLQIQSAANRQIHVLGKLNHHDMLVLFSQSDVYCLPSESEGFATTLLEAAACQCPIIMSDTGGASELVLNNQYGLILPDTKPESIAAALKMALSDTEWRIKAGTLLRNRVEEQFDWRVTVDRILNKLEKLAERRRQDG